jgi:uncharacterized protein (DUF927 family)
VAKQLKKVTSASKPRKKQRAQRPPSKAKKRLRPLLIKRAIAEDEATGQAYEIFHFRKRGNREGKISISRDEASDRDKVMTQLVRHNADFAMEDKSAAEAVAHVLSGPPEEEWRIVAHTGWHRQRTAFVMVNGVIDSDKKRKVRLQPPMLLRQRAHIALRHSGTLQGWKDGVAKPARFSSSMMLAISACFAAPLLELAQLQPFVINLFGKSRSGKTTELLAATSPMGIGGESELPNWNITDAAFQELARTFNCLLFPLNELALLKGNPQNLTERLKHMTYVMHQGRETARSTASSYAVPASAATWRCIVLSTSERSIESIVRSTKGMRDPGERARAHDVRAVFDDRTTVFDRRPHNVAPIGFELWAEKKLHSVREACRVHHGKALTPVIRKLMAFGAKAKSQARTWMDEFLQAQLKHSPSGELQHAARNFACVYAGGRWESKPTCSRGKKTNC